MNAVSSVLALIACCWCTRSCHGWSQAELDLFDLVEEIGQNFYELLQIEKTASSSEVRKAYRRLSLQYHPDKNSDPDAAETFRKIGAVAEVLRDEELRAMYDEVLIQGLPDWKQPIYYYRRVRKMSVWELLALLLSIATFAQFLYGWAQYFEKWLVLNELLEKKARKEQRGAKARKQTSLQLEMEIMIYKELANACIPHYSRLLPVVMVKKLFHLLLSLFYLLKWCCVSMKQRFENGAVQNEPPKTTIAATRSSSRGKQGRDRQLANTTHTSKSEIKSSKSGCEEEENKAGTPSRQRTTLMKSSSQRKNGYRLDKPESMNTEDDKKNGTDYLGTETQLSPTLLGSDAGNESTYKALELPEKDETYLENVVQDISPVVQDSTENKNSMPNKVVRSKTHDHQTQVQLSDIAMGVVQGSVGGDVVAPVKAAQNKENKRKNRRDLPDSGKTVITDPAGNWTVDNPKEGEAWSQFQQEQLEWALKQYPRSAENRWQLIAMSVPGKSEADCKKRYKMLVDLVHRKRSSSAAQVTESH